MVIKMYDVVIIGSGPAGLTAAIYTSRANLKTAVIAGALWGGQLMLTSEIENFPGFKDSILGPDLMDNMWGQAERFGTEMVFDDATTVDFSSRPFKVTVETGEIYEGKTVIIATGASTKWLGIPGEELLRGKGVSSCATCDGAFFKGKRVTIVGGGDTAMEEAQTLIKFAREITIVHRREKLKASKILQEKIFKIPKVKFIWNSTVQEILGENKVEGIRLRKVDTNEEFEVKTDGVFVAIGHKPNTEIFRGQIEMDDAGYIIAKDSTRTNVEGIFVAGDVQDKHYRQAITAAGLGCKAAMDAISYLEEE
jgi:thioredoxin reductase (NADPH)